TPLLICKYYTPYLSFCQQKNLCNRFFCKFFDSPLQKCVDKPISGVYNATQKGKGVFQKTVSEGVFVFLIVPNREKPRGGAISIFFSLYPIIFPHPMHKSYSSGKAKASFVNFTRVPLPFP